MMKNIAEKKYRGLSSNSESLEHLTDLPKSITLA